MQPSPTGSSSASLSTMRPQNTEHKWFMLQDAEKRNPGPQGPRCRWSSVPSTRPRTASAAAKALNVSEDVVGGNRSPGRPDHFRGRLLRGAPPAAARRRHKPAVAHDVEAGLSKVVAPRLAARPLVDRIHRPSVTARRINSDRHKHRVGHDGTASCDQATEGRVPSARRAT